MAIGGGPLAHELDQLGTKRAPRGPHRLVGDRVDAGPDGGVVDVQEPVGAEVAIQ